MAFNFDIMGTPISITTGYEGLSNLFETDDERRRRREREIAANTVVSTQKVETFQDGSQTETTKREIPAAVAPDESEAERQRLLRQAQQPPGVPVVPGAPASPSISVTQQSPEEIARRAQALRQMAQGGMPTSTNTTPTTAGGAMTQDQYNQYIAQNESGAQQNIGYHAPGKSTAYGPYGLTQAAYKDARSINPSLPQNIAQATPDQMTQAQNAYTQQNTRYLQNYGVEPTQGNLALAHFLGAKGASDYLNTGYISPEAAARNGGEERVRQIAQQRLAMGAAPVSGAAPAPAAPAPAAPAPAAPVSPYSLATGQGGIGLRGPQGQMAAVSPESQLPVFGEGIQVAGAMQMPPAIETPVQKSTKEFYNGQDDISSMLKFAYDEKNPEFLRNRARERAAELNALAVKKDTAQKEIGNLSPQQAARELTSKKPEGSWLKMLLLSYISPQLAGEEAVKLGFGNKWTQETLQTDSGELGVEVKRSANGQILEAYRLDNNQPLTSQELSGLVGGSLPKGVHVTKVDNVIDPNNPKQMIQMQTLSNGKTRYMLGGEQYKGDKTGLVNYAKHVDQENRRVNAAYTDLKNMYANPTPEQKRVALQKAGVSKGRIEEELGLPAGSLNTAPARVEMQQAAPAGGATITTQVNPSSANQSQHNTILAMNDQPPVMPTLRSQALGETNQAYTAYVDNVKKTYDKQMDIYQTQQKFKQKDADEFSKKKDDVRNTLEKFRQGIEIIDKNEHNLGPNFSIKGAGPLPGVQQFFGAQFGTDDSTNTDILRSLITRGGLEGIKNYMGPAISNFDVQTWMKNNPINERSQPSAIRAWLVKTHDAMLAQAESQRQNAIKQGFVEPSFTLGNPLSSATPSASGAYSDPEKERRYQEYKRQQLGR